MKIKSPLKSGILKSGRPRLDPEKARSHRVVTFITSSDLEKLYRIAEQEERSLSWIVHRILSDFLARGCRLSKR